MIIVNLSEQQKERDLPAWTSGMSAEHLRSLGYDVDPCISGTDVLVAWSGEGHTHKFVPLRDPAHCLAG